MVLFPPGRSTYRLTGSRRKVRGPWKPRFGDQACSKCRQHQLRNWKSDSRRRKRHPESCSCHSRRASRGSCLIPRGYRGVKARQVASSMQRLTLVLRRVDTFLQSLDEMQRWSSCRLPFTISYSLPRSHGRREDSATLRKSTSGVPGLLQDRARSTWLSPQYLPLPKVISPSP